MADSLDNTKYDESLESILVKEKSILGFFSTIFNFLARRTDFYYVPTGPYENMGFPAGVAEELVLKVLRTCDPKTWDTGPKPTDINNEIMCSTVAQEVEITTETEDVDCHDTDDIQSEMSKVSISADNVENKSEDSHRSDNSDYERPPMLPTQKNSETYNGTDCGKYCWSQTITELGVIAKLPPNTKSKDLKVTINPGDISVAHKNGEVIMNDTLPFKIKAIDSFWSLSEGRLIVHLEKAQERWWPKLLNGEEGIDLDRIDCSRPLDELPEDHVAKVRELQWNQEQKLKGLPTSDELRNLEILKKAWNAAGSPFKGQEFDPNVLQHIEKK